LTAPGNKSEAEADAETGADAAAAANGAANAFAQRPMLPIETNATTAAPRAQTAGKRDVIRAVKQDAKRDETRPEKHGAKQCKARRVKRFIENIQAENSKLIEQRKSVQIVPARCAG